MIHVAAAARIRQAKEADADRVRFLAAEGPEAAKAEVARLFDEMSAESKALEILVERDDHYLQACFTSRASLSVWTGNLRSTSTNSRTAS